MRELPSNLWLDPAQRPRLRATLFLTPLGVYIFERPRSGATGRMTRVLPWHSTRESDRKVYHDSDRCTEGNNIEEKYRNAATDGRPSCKELRRAGEVVGILAGCRHE